MEKRSGWRSAACGRAPKVLVDATPHRVIDHGTARQSIGFFLEPALGARLDCVRSAMPLSDTPASAKGTYGWHLLRRIHGYKGFEDLVPYPQ